MYVVSESYEPRSCELAVSVPSKATGQMTTIAILTDIHLRREFHDEILSALRSVHSTIQKQHDPDHLFVLGDLIEDARAELDRHHVQTVASVLESGEIPVTYLLGNHDAGTLTREDLSGILSQEGFYSRITVGDQPFVYVDSSRDGVGARGVLGPTQRSWLQEAIPEQSIILSHHPLGPFSLGENVWFRDYPERALLWDRKEVLTILEENAIATVSGHIHQTGKTQFRGLSHISINAFSKERPGKPVSGTYAILSVEDSRHLTVYRMEEIVDSFQL